MPKHLSGKQSQHGKTYLDEIDARATKGVFASAAHQDPPYTREKYLEYFRSIAYGESSLQKHGGNRRVDIQMARELSSLYARNSRGRTLPKYINVEDDVRTSRFLLLVPPLLSHAICLARLYIGLLLRA